jgi:type II secretory pathway pseudopilin PulG
MTTRNNMMTKDRNNERGYALTATLAIMAVMALALVAAAPNLQKQKQRDLELEAIARGEHIAEAIGLFIRCRRRPPNSMEELLKEGCPARPGGVSTKRRYLLRASDFKDPLAPDSEDLEESNWRLIPPQQREIINFSRAIAEYAGGQTPQHRQFPEMQQFAPVTIQTIRGLDGDKSSDGDEGSTDEDYKGPFIGVGSRSSRDSVITYYGLENHRRWVFTPAYR